MKRSWVIFLISTTGFGQSLVANVQRLGVEDGLSQSSIYSIYQDRKGLLWIGTADGLNRYDGRQLKVFKAPVNINEPSNANFIRGKIVEDRAGNIWYSSENGLYVLDQSLEVVRKKYSFSRRELAGSDYLLCLIDPSEVIWLQSVWNGFASYSIRTGVFKADSLRGIDKERIVGINFDSEHQNIWYVLNRNDGAYRFNTGSGTTTHHWPDEDLRLIRFMKGGYVTTGNGEIRMYDSVRREVRNLSMPPINPLHIRDIQQDAFNRLWIATFEEGLWCFELSTNRLTRIDDGNTTPFIMHLTTLLIDRTQNLWAGTDDGGVIKFDLKPPVFKSISAATLGLASNEFFIKSIVEDRSGNIWISSLNNPLIVYDPSTNKRINHPWLAKIGIMKSPFLSMDSQGSLWTIDEKSMFQIDSLGHLTRYPNLLAALYKPIVIHHLDRLNNGQVVIAANIGLYTMSEHHSGDPTVKVLVDGFQATSFVETKEGDIWVSSKNLGLFHVIPSRDGTYKIRKNIFPEMDINAMHVDRLNPDLIWLASDKGLIRFNRISSHFDLYSEAEGMNNGYVYGILEDADHSMWCSTNGGVSRLDPGTSQFVNYSVKDGLLNNEFNSDAFVKGSAGHMYFGGVKGLTWFKSEELEADQTTPPTAVTEVVVTDVRIQDSDLATGKLDLPYFRNDVYVRFAVFDFSKPESNKVRYQLKGWDKKPQITYNLESHYNNLPPGTYTLSFSGSTSNNRWSEEQTLQIVIEPPFWQRWWFNAAVVWLFIALITGMVWLFTRQKYNRRIVALEKLNALEKERRRISMEMHDDIGASLTQITLISEAAKHSQEKQHALDQVARTSRAVVATMSEIIWSLNPDNKSFDQLMSYLRDQLHNLLESSGIDYLINLPERAGFLLTNPFKRNIIQLVKEAVNNAVKHANAKHIAIRGCLSDAAFEIEIEDDGIGFDCGSPMGNGIRNMKARTAEMGGSLRITSEKAKGTTVHFVFPVAESYHKNHIVS